MPNLSRNVRILARKFTQLRINRPQLATRPRPGYRRAARAGGSTLLQVRHRMAVVNAVSPTSSSPSPPSSATDFPAAGMQCVVALLNPIALTGAQTADSHTALHLRP